MSLRLIERELLLFALFWFIVGLVDELAVDLAWLALCARRQWRETGWSGLAQAVHALIVGAPRVAQTPGQSGEPAPLSGRLAVFVPAWREDAVIGTTIAHMLGTWREPNYRIYVGCYCNDPRTIAAAMAAAGVDTRLRIVIHDRPGPTTKADCLNRIYAALMADERRLGEAFRAVVLHDSEDMVHPLELGVIDAALASADFVQLPVRPEFPPGNRWVAGHYCDEFVESHSKGLVVRAAMRAGLPAAGVGCAFGRCVLERIRAQRGGEGAAGPFAAECLTEDYELGLLIARMGGRSRFVRQRDAGGSLIATRSYFPTTLPGAVRQKTRWIHGISLQGWDRLGWSPRPVDMWMALRDRRGPLTALVLAVGYALVVVEAVMMALRAVHLAPPTVLAPGARLAMGLALAGFAWRAAMRFVFTAREYGWAEGLRAVLRIPVANIITIMAGRRAFMAYCRTLRGMGIVWDKTEHRDHPAWLAMGSRPS